MLFAGLVLLVALLDVGVGPEIVTWPLLLAGSGLGMMASQLGAVTVSAVPDEKSGEVGGLQNTGTQLGASIGTALAGAVLISAMTASFFTGIQNNPNVPDSVVSKAQHPARKRRAVHVRGRRQGRAQEGERAPRDRRRDRQGQQAEPDRRAARRGGHPRTPRAHRAPVHPRDPDRPTRRPDETHAAHGIEKTLTSGHDNAIGGSDALDSILPVRRHSLASVDAMANAIDLAANRYAQIVVVRHERDTPTEQGSTATLAKPECDTRMIDVPPVRPAYQPSPGRPSDDHKVVLRRRASDLGSGLVSTQSQLPRRGIDLRVAAPFESRGRTGPPSAPEA